MKLRKQINLLYYRVILTVVMGLSALAGFAQDKGLDIDIDINKKDDHWYARPWAWVIGGAIFILLLVALLRRGRR